MGSSSTNPVFFRFKAKVGVRFASHYGSKTITGVVDPPVINVDYLSAYGERSASGNQRILQRSNLADFSKTLEYPADLLNFLIEPGQWYYRYKGEENRFQSETAALIFEAQSLPSIVLDYENEYIDFNDILNREDIRVSNSPFGQAQLGRRTKLGSR